MQFKEKETFEKIIKNGKYLFVYPILSVFLSKEKNFLQNSTVNLVGTLVKKKF
ncbi:hypothetical protein [Blattabacterium sp. (Nauphoeta cinerea)]|uniref:hypothetical protein n=1 Tax=Blattabacterium sp. (Nauphoeta cinerea) TaxID=1316444 RepID=UPI00040CF248|nr:hypothetical protein [Blattabacterium sp. (Nauphoeta cinerea)]